VAQAVLKRIASGDRAAVNDCISSYGGLVWSLAKKMLRNQDDAEDAVQEIFIDIWKNAGRFDDTQASEATFIAMIAKRRLIDRIRFMKRRIVPESIEDMLSEPAGRDLDKMQYGVEANEAAKALETLRPEQRQVLVLSIVKGMSHKEISEATGMPLGTVKTHARRGLMEVRAFLGLGNTAKEAAG
jgi:RNA polymerase sigma-70 factor (ECF subfamily)